MLVGFVGVFDAATDITQQVIGVVQIIANTQAYTGCCRSAGGVGRLMKQLDTDLQLGQQLIGQHASGHAEIP